MSEGGGRYHWSNCADSAKFFKINALASVPWLLCILFPKWVTFSVAIFFTLFCVYVEIIKGMTLISYGRGLIVLMTGRIKSTVNIIDELIRG